MTLKDSLLRKGYLPEDLPPPFTSAPIADYFLANPPRNYLMRPERRLRAATYNASKRGMTRRMFSAIHPVTAHDSSHFLAERWQDISTFFAPNNVSYSIPTFDASLDRALTINSHSALEKEKHDRLSSFRFIATTDISRFYHSIYTHSIPWAFHGRALAKTDTRIRSAKVFFNRADAIIRNGQDGQTVGIPVGPDMSRAFAELIATAIDMTFVNQTRDIECETLRHVDDVWIGAHSHAEAERALSRYREAIREYELDINENKTDIFAADFSFSDFWPTEISRQLEFAVGTKDYRSKERLRAALENSFSLAVERKDDGILKYTLRLIDQSKLGDEHWDVVEPYLKRLSVHFGHTIDYVARILVWRYLARGDLKVESWTPILKTVLDNHGRLGNDSEVCWILYVHQIFGVDIDRGTAIRIIHNCGALALVALLHSSHRSRRAQQIFTEALNRLDNETDDGRFWPALLEWKLRRWPEHTQISLINSTIEKMSGSGAYIYDQDMLPVVFRDIEEAQFSDVKFAIEPRTSMYDNEGEDMDEEGEEEHEEDYEYF